MMEEIVEGGVKKRATSGRVRRKEKDKERRRKRKKR